MKTATQNLEADHVNIMMLIDVIEKLTLCEEPNVEQLENAISLIRNFADGTHHAKEETLLFPFLTEKGFSLTQGPVGIMLNEHTQGRIFVKAASESLAEFKNGDVSAIKSTYQNLMEYAYLLRNHINKENNVLFRMADNAMTDDEQLSLLKKFDAIDEVGVGNENSTGYISHIKALAAIFL